MTLVRRPLQIIRSHRRAFVLVNVVMYGLFLAGFALGLAVPELAAGRATALEEDGTADLVGSLLANVWLFAVTILGVNTITVGLFSIVLPSLVIPFAGIAVFGYRAVVIGVTLAPTDDATWIVLIPHSLTVIIEFQAYILLVLGVYLLGRAWITPSRIGERTHRRGYLQGLRQLGWLTLAALALLVIGALYEAVTLRYLVPVLLRP
ncbi:stage II sporulation protein M [Brachybacterium sp. FME24]|uniref:stage II sporulation protein M n=1 Tax=Brachybacterium sp. FME24 TaxID=2742605 RepID=UPI0018675155|nr:stage II sporulation protein M [Brachybacterium sp. FME24]